MDRESAAIDEARRYWSAKVMLHLCSRAMPTSGEWQAMFDRLVDDIERFSELLQLAGNDVAEGELDPREPLVWVWCLLDTMPNDHEQLYQQLPEADAEGGGIEDRLDRLRVSGYVMDGPRHSRGCVTWLAVLARTLDDDLSDLVTVPEDPATWLASDWLVPGYECYVIPVKRRFRLAKNRPAQRRALCFTAVVPTRLRDATISLHFHPGGSPHRQGVDPYDWALGSAIFPEMSIRVRSTAPSKFILTDAMIPGADAAMLGEQLSVAQKELCDLLVWPELTMPDARLQALRELLTADPLDQGGVPVVIAGSWHVPTGEGDDFRNRCVVMTGNGDVLVTYDKRRRFPWNEQWEDIGVGENIPIIVMNDRLIGLAICRDFCDDNPHDPYRELPLDLLVVPSMGQKSTLDAHIRRAAGQRHRQGTIIFVVQQVPVIEGGQPPSPTDPPAYSFALPDHPAAASTFKQHVAIRVIT